MFSPRELQLITQPPDLSVELRSLLQQIPAGRVTSYGDLAEALGDLHAARWVATELQTFDPEDDPVHRVLRRTGEVIGTARFPVQQRCQRLRQEGVTIRKGAVETRTFGWTDFTGSRPLKQLQAVQQRLLSQMKTPPLQYSPQRVAGVDVSYSRDGRGVAAYVVVETKSRKIVQQETAIAEIRFPYIPGYLSFRELPVYAKLREQIERSGQIEPWVLVDGNGILHPRRAGIACQLGCLWSVRTVGVSKHQLCGKVANQRLNRAELRADDGTILGYRLQRESKRGTLYVSPGWDIDVDGAWMLVDSQMQGHRLPDPIYHADRLSREVARQL